MKRGPIPKKDHVVILTPDTRMGLLEDLKRMEDEVLNIKNILLLKKMGIQEQIDNLLVVYNEIQVIHSTIRELGSGVDQ